MNILDSITIWYPLLSKIYINKINVKYQIPHLFLVIALNYLSSNKINIFLYKKLSIIIVILLIYNNYKKIDLNFIIYAFFTFVFKISQNITLLKIFNTELKMHLLWHIFGAKFFKKVAEL